MRVPIKWLKQYVDIDLPLKELAHQFTMHSLEIEGITEGRKDLDKVVIGRVEHLQKHPNADKLNLCKVQVGLANGGELQIVCGAQNVHQGAIVPVALVGAVLPGNFVIKQATIRGVDSFGMICSEKELGLAEESVGILLLPVDAQLYGTFASYMGLDQESMEVAILPNRGDCQSMIGIAREAAAVLRKPLKLPDFKITKNVIKEKVSAKVIVQDTNLCPRYMARVVKDVKIAPSPSWMQECLQASGVRPINNIVDTTNYILLELGQPLHAFDYDKLSGHTIVVRRAVEGETFVTLDDKPRILTSDMLMICDGEKPVALAGIMGGKNSEISDRTVNVLIESAYFDPTGIRKTSKKMAIRTESSQRFEKGVDFGGVEKALHRAAQLMAEYGGGKVVEEHIDVVDSSNKLSARQTIAFNAERVSDVLGMSLDIKEMISILESLGFTFEQDMIIVPSWRTLDVSRMEDLIEEIARVKGYEHVPVTMPGKYVPVIDDDPVDVLSARARASLTGSGLNEIVTFSITSPEEFGRLGLEPSNPFVLSNPLSVEESVMRTQMASSLLNVIAANYRRQMYDIKLFEIGRVFVRDKDGKPREQVIAAGAITGNLHDGVIYNAERKNDAAGYYDVKGIVDKLLIAVNIKKCDYETDSKCPYMHTGRTAIIKVGNNVIGTVGQLNTETVSKYDIDQPVLYFELNLTQVARFANNKIRFAQLPKYPITRRDTTIWIKNSVVAKEIEEAIYKSAGKILTRVELIDRYAGKNIHGDDYYNLCYAMYFQSEEKTLTDAEVDAIFGKVIDSLQQKIGAKFG